MINAKKLERVAKAICRAAKGGEHVCLWCETPYAERSDGVCWCWPQFVGEAEAAIKAMKGF